MSPTHRKSPILPDGLELRQVTHWKPSNHRCLYPSRRRQFSCKTTHSGFFYVKKYSVIWFTDSAVAVFRDFAAHLRDFVFLRLCIGPSVYRLFVFHSKLGLLTHCGPLQPLAIKWLCKFFPKFRVLLGLKHGSRHCQKMNHESSFNSHTQNWRPLMLLRGHLHLLCFSFYGFMLMVLCLCYMF